MLLRKADDIGAEAGIAAGMLDDRKAAIGTDAETRGIADFAAIVQSAAFDHPCDDVRPPDTLVVEIFIPEREIFHCRQQAGRADRIEVRVGDLNPGLRPDIAVGDIPDNFGIVVAKERVVHAKRFKNPGRGKGTERLPADHLHDLRQQGITRVAIEVLVTRLEVQILLPADDREDVVIGDQVLGVAPAGEAQQFPVIAQATRMVHEVPEGDRCAEIRQAGHVFTHHIIKRQFSFGRQQQDGKCSELFGDRC